ncbi:MAG: MFS transporter [Pacificimonas sp.]
MEQSGYTLPRWRRLAYGFGDFGFNLYWATTSLYLLYFYTDVLGLPNQVAGLIMLVALVWDGITDPVMGYIAERTRSRWGSYRPYILFGALPLSATMVLMFYAPEAEGMALIIYAAATHVLMRTVYTVMSIPFSSLSARMTRSSEVRNELAAFRMVFATLAGLFVAFFTLRLVAWFGAGDAATGFFWTACLYAALSLPIFLFVFLTTREPPVDIDASRSRPNLKIALSSLRTNGPFLIVFTATVLSVAAGVMASKTLIYYYKYNLGDEQASGTALAFITGGAAVFVPIWAWVTSETSKRFVWSTGLAISFCVSLALWFNPIETVPMVTALFALGAAGSAAGYLSFWSMLPDTVEYGEWQTGERTESLVFGLMSLAQKASFGIAAGVLGILLDAVGYSANEMQAEETLGGLKAIMTLLPAALIGAAFLLVRTYPLDRQLHARLERAIARRRTVTSPT